ncbi:unnamed protein product [Staurois parvus]|uniref:Uncharacterized protein n=1 Tax=Staurois parvus TaxID=386267 RepID=A0ABN9CCN4_9NEOB|nr:unnamed protein product [Staurois parvus]
MTLGRKGLTSGAIKGLIVCCGDKLLCIAFLCRAIQSSLFVLTGERSVLFTYRPLPVSITQRSPDISWESLA